MQRMKDLEGRLRAGMTANGIGPEAHDSIVQGISSFALRLRIQQLMRGISLAVSMTFFLDTLRAIAVRSEVRSY